MKKLLFLYLAVCSLAFSQGVRYDPVPVLTTASNVPSGAMAPVFAIGGSKIHVCNFPSNAVPCTNYATTYTDVTLNTACPNNAQITLPGTTQCVAATDQQGNFGFWVNPGEYSYTITVPSGQSYGPYPIMTLNNGSQLSYLQGSTGSVPRTVTNRLQDYVSIKDFGAVGDGVTDNSAAFTHALNLVCSTGGKLYMPPGVYATSTTIKTPKQCNGIVFDGGGGYQTQGAIIKWIGASGGTVMNLYASSWDSFKNFTIDGNNLAGKGLWVQASNVSPNDGSTQKNVFENLMIINCTGSPGYGLEVAGLNNDDVSQNDFRDIDLASNTYNLYQDGIQTLKNIYHNITSYNPGLHGFYFNAGDISMYDNTFLVDPAASPGTLTQLDHVYFGPSASWAALYNNHYECLSGLNAAIFHNYEFPAGSAPNRPFRTTIVDDRVQWSLVGGKVMDYNQQGPLDIFGHNADDVSGTAAPGQYYINSGLGFASVQANISSGFFASPSYLISLGNNVLLKSDNPSTQVFDKVFEANDASYTSGSSTLAVGGTPFTSSVVGWFCYVQGYASATAQQQKITAFIDSSHVTLAAAATSTGSSKFYRCGRNINQGSAFLVTSTPSGGSAVDGSTYVSDGISPRYWMRQVTNSGATANWALRSTATGSFFSIYNGDSPVSATPSDFMQFINNGTAASSVTFPVPLRIGGATHQLVGIYYQDFTGIAVGTIAANSSFSTTVTLTGDTVTSGLDGCQAWGGISVGGIVSQCAIETGNTALVTYANVTASSINVGTVTIRVEVHKFSYTGP